MARGKTRKVAKNITWYEALDIVRPHVVRISTPRGSGTGFLVTFSKTKSICGIATAAHVIDHAHYWEEPIRIDHIDSGESLLIREPQRAIFLDPSQDTAAILFAKNNLPFPTDTLPLAPEKMYLRVGNDIGWLGFPAISQAGLCFFGGRVSAWLQDREAYLVDGVAINGVSGGPAFHLAGDRVVIMGVVSAYIPNRATGEALPGLGMIRSVKQFHELAPTFKSLDEAKTKESPPASVPPPPETDVKPDVPSSKRST